MLVRVGDMTPKTAALLIRDRRRGRGHDARERTECDHGAAIA